MIKTRKNVLISTSLMFIYKVHTHTHSVRRLCLRAVLVRVVLPALKETPEYSVQTRDRLTPFLCDSLRSGQVGCCPPPDTQGPRFLPSCFSTAGPGPPCLQGADWACLRSGWLEREGAPRRGSPEDPRRGLHHLCAHPLENSVT